MKNTTKSYLIISLLVIFGLIKKFALNNIFNSNVNDIILLLFWLFLLVISLLLLKFPKEKNIYRNIVTKMVISNLLLTILVCYLLGLFTGFSSNMFVNNFLATLKVVIPFLIITIIREIIRYIIAKNSVFDKKPIFIATCIFILFELSLNNISISGGESIFYFVSVTLLPLIAHECLCSYLAYNFGLMPCLVYTIPLALYAYVLPIIPLLGNYINSIVFLFLPFMIFFRSYRIIKYENKVDIKVSKMGLLFAVPLFIFTLVLISLISGLFKHKMIVIASNSMNPVYERGDAVIYEKITNPEEISLNDILVFEYDGKVITHRVIGIYNYDDHFIFNTKGDNNEIKDNFDVDEKSILGVVKYIVKYIGYPSIWFNESMKGM